MYKQYLLTDFNTPRWKGIITDNIPELIEELNKKRNLEGFLYGEEKSAYPDISLSYISHDIKNIIYIPAENKIYGDIKFLPTTSGQVSKKAIEKWNSKFEIRIEITNSDETIRIKKIFTWDVISNINNTRINFPWISDSTDKIKVSEEIIQNKDNQDYFDRLLNEKDYSYSDKVVFEKIKQINQDAKPLDYMDLCYEDKRRILRQFMMKSKDANTAVITIKSKLNGILSEKYFKLIDEYYLTSLLIDGYIAFEIIYDNHINRESSKILKLEPIDPITLVPYTDKWIHYPDNKNKKRILYKSQVLYIIGSPFNFITSIVEGVYLDLLDINNPNVINEITKNIYNSIKNEIINLNI